MELTILPSALMDIARTKFFYDNIEEGLGARFRDYILGEIDKLTDSVRDHKHQDYFYRLAPRFHQCIYYKIGNDQLVVWRVLDTRFDPRKIEAALSNHML